MKIVLMFPYLHSSPSRAREVLSSTKVQVLSSEHDVVYAGLTKDSIENLKSVYNIESVFQDFHPVRKGKLALFFYTFFYLLKHNVDVIYERASHIPIGLILAIFFRKKYVTDAHLLSINSSPKSKKYRNLYRMIDLIRFKTSSIIVGNFESQVKAIELVLGKKYDNTINLGPYIDSHKFHPIPRKLAKKKLGIQRDYLSYIGSFDYDHKPEFIISSFEILCKNYDYVDLFMVGSGPKLEFLRGLVNSLGINDRVCFTGRVDNSLVPLYIAGSLFCINPTITPRNKIVGLIGDKSLEYASCGKVQLVPSLSGISKELSKINGAIQVGDTSKPENLAKAASFLIENPSVCNKMGQNARAKIEQDWNILMYKKILLKSLSEIANNRK